MSLFEATPSGFGEEVYSQKITPTRKEYEQGCEVRNSRCPGASKVKYKFSTTDWNTNSLTLTKLPPLVFGYPTGDFHHGTRA